MSAYGGSISSTMVDFRFLVAFLLFGSYGCSFEYFFSKPNYMNTNSNRCFRTTGEGFYKSTGQVREVKAELSQDVIGKKRILPFLEGRAPEGKITKYVMHEFSLPKTKQAQLGPNPNQQREFVLNHLTTKSVNYKKRRYDSICDKLAEPGIASNYKDDEAAAAANMILEPEEHLADKDVLFGSKKRNEGAESESANGSYLIDNNDISTLDVGLPGGCFSSGSDILAVNDSFHHEVSFQPERNRISPFHPSSLADDPLRSPVHTTQDYWEMLCMPITLSLLACNDGSQIFR